MKVFNNIQKNSKFYITLFNFINIYYLISIFFLFFKDDFFFRNLILSFQFIFIPIGIVFLFSNWLNIEILIKKFNKIERIFLSFFFGHIFIILLYFFLDKLGILKSLYIYIYPFLFLSSYLGFYYARKKIIETKLLLLNRISQKNVYYIILASSITILVCYFINFSFFWDYPLINLYQEVHFLNAAQNLAYNKSIDNFNSASSFPLLQIFFSNLIFFYNLDHIDFYINFKIPNYFINVLVVYCFFKNFIKDNRIIFCLILLFSMTSHLLLSSNPGDSVGIYSLFLINFFIKNTDSANSGLGFFSKSIFLIFIFILMILLRYLKIDFYNYFIIFLIAFFILVFFKRKIFNISTYLFFFLIILFLVPYHRSAFLFVFCSILVIFLHLVIYNKNIFNDLHKKLFFYVGLVFGIYVFVDLGSLIYFNNNWFSFNFLNLIPTSVFELLANKKILNVYDQGSGSLGSVLEFFRRLGEPTLLILVFSSMVGFCKFFYEYQINNVGNLDSSFKYKNLILITAIPILFFLSFNSIPYTYRAQFVLVLMILAFIGVQISKYKELIFNTYFKFILLIFFYFVLALYFNLDRNFIFEFFTKASFSVNFGSSSSYSIYDENLKKYRLILLGISFFILIITSLSLFKKYKFHILFLQIFTIFLYSQFLTMPLKYFAAYPYKGSPDNITLSHYQLTEINIAKEIKKKIVDQKIYFSDPATLGIFLSYSNAYPLYPFINLSLEHESVKLSFNEVNKYLKLCSINGNCDRDVLTEKLNKFRNVELAEYVQVTNFFKLKNKKLRNEDLIFLINSRFLNFKNRDEDYFPNYEKLSLDQIRNLKEIFTVIINSEDKILVCILK